MSPNPSLDRVEEALRPFLSPSSASSTIQVAMRRAGVVGSNFDPGTARAFVRLLEQGVRLFLRDNTKYAECVGSLRALELGSNKASSERRPVRLTIESEHDIVEARGRARALAATVGFRETDQVKIATVVSELARNIVLYAKLGEIVVEPLSHPSPGISIEARDEGPGIRDLEMILAGEYKSRTGLGLGLLGCRRIMDGFTIESTPGHGTVVRVHKHL